MKGSHIVGNVSIITFTEPVTALQGKEGMLKGCCGSYVFIILILPHRDADCRGKLLENHPLRFALKTKREKKIASSSFFKLNIKDSDQSNLCALFLSLVTGT